MRLQQTSLSTETAPVPIHWSRGIVVKRKFELSPTAFPKRAKTRQVSYANLLLQVESLHTTGLESRVLPATATERRFNQLAQAWKSDTALLSDLSKKSMHPAYQSIIGMGQDALPMLLRELDKYPSHWFWALRAITGANPVKPENRGRIKRMAQDWLEWGRDHGYQW